MISKHNQLQPITKISKWDERFFSMAQLVAEWSEDQSRKVGAVIIGSAHEVRSTGYNGLPRGINSDVEMRHSKINNEKYLWFEHAERNAIYNAARSGVALEGCEIYTTLFPCSACISAIIQTGISTLSTYAPPKDDPRFDRSFEVAIELIVEANLTLRVFDRSS